MFYLAMIRDTTVNGDEKACFPLRKLAYSLTAQPISFGMTMRDIDFKILESNTSKKIMHNNSPRNTVRIVIAVNDNLFSAINCRENSHDRFFHIFHQIRIVGILLKTRVEKPLGTCIVKNAPLKKNLAHERRIGFERFLNVKRYFWPNSTYIHHNIVAKKSFISFTMEKVSCLKTFSHS